MLLRVIRLLVAVLSGNSEGNVMRFQTVSLLMGLTGLMGLASLSGCIEATNEKSAVTSQELEKSKKNNEIMQKLSGTWRTACEQVAADRSTDRTAVFTNSGFMNSADTTYAGAGCQRQILTLAKAAKYEVSRNTNPNSPEVQFTLESTSYVTSNGYAETANAGKLCDYISWQDNIPKDVSGQTCKPYTHSMSGSIFNRVLNVDTSNLDFEGKTYKRQ